MALTTHGNYIECMFGKVSIVMMVMGGCIPAFTTGLCRDAREDSLFYCSRYDGMGALGILVSLMPDSHALLDCFFVFALVFAAIHLFVFSSLDGVSWVISVLFVCFSLAFLAMGRASILTTTIFFEEVQVFCCSALRALFFGHKKPPVNSQLVCLSRAYQC